MQRYYISYKAMPIIKPIAPDLEFSETELWASGYLPQHVVEAIRAQDPSLICEIPTREEGAAPNMFDEDWTNRAPTRSAIPTVQCKECGEQHLVDDIKFIKIEEGIITFVCPVTGNETDAYYRK